MLAFDAGLIPAFCYNKAEKAFGFRFQSGLFTFDSNSICAN